MSSDSQILELGNYRVLNRDNGSLWELGKGSYGTTYKATHIGLERISALKVINDHLIRNDLAKQRFQQEAKAAASLDHAHIASIHDFGEVDGMFYYAMKYCSGGDLENFSSRRGPQPWSVVKSFALQILGALKAAHDKGMLHRDLKPSNIMLADENEPINLQLIDFGLVKALDHHNPSETSLMATREGAFMGNPLTASPEQFREEDLDERSDLFSFGITLWYLLHGGSPFGNVAAAKIAHQRLSVKSYDDMLPESLPDDARSVLSKLLATNRDQRFRYAQEVIDALQSSADQSTRVAEPAPAAASTAAAADPPPLTEDWEITSPIKQLPYGTYYGCYYKQSPSTPPGTIFIPDELSPHLDAVHRHAGQLVQYESLGLCNFSREGEIDGTRIYFCQGLSNCTLHFLLQLVNRLNIHNDLALLKQVALAVDEAAVNQLSGVEMEDNEIFLALDPSLGKAQLSAEEWPGYIQNEARAEGGHTAGIVAIVLPRLIDDTSVQEASATIGGDDLASNPLARFAGFLYRVLSGMSAKQTAYLSTVNYVSFSDVSEESNQFLSHIIAGMETPDSALSMLQQVCSNEGSHFDGAAATIQKSVAATNPFAEVGPLPQKVASPPSARPISPQASLTTPIPPPQTSPSATAVIPPPQTSAAATAVVPPPQVAPSAPKAKSKSKPRKKTKKKGNPIITVLFTLILLGALGAGGYFGWQHLQKKKKNTNEEFVYEGPVEDGIGEINFTRTVFGDGIDAVPIGLQDSKGVTLGSFQKIDQSIKITDFPIDVFKDGSRWPLKFASLDSNYLLISDSLDMDSFTDTGSEVKTNENLITLKSRQSTLLSASLTFGGNTINNGNDFLKSLTGKDGANQWRISTDSNGTRLTLEEGQSFPVDARLAIPYMKPVDLTINRGTSIEATITIKTRPIKFIGIESTHQFKFTPDFTKISDEAVRDLLRGKSDSLSTTGNDLQQKGNVWQIPSLPGSIAVNYSGQSNFIRVVNATKQLVFEKQHSYLPEESDSMVKMRKLAESGDITSQVNLAVMHFVGKKGDTSDGLSDRFSFLWYFAAAEQNDVGAQTEVGQAYMEGIGVDPNPEKAFSWLSKGAKENHPKALGLLGVCHERGLGCEKDPNKAIDYYTRAAKLGNLEAMGNLAGSYLETESKDKHAEAITWLETAAKQNHPYSTYVLGWAYHTGTGIKEDEKLAIKFLEKAKELGNIDADLLLMQLKKK